MPRLYSNVICKKIVKIFWNFEVRYTQTCTSLKSSTIWHPKRGHHSVFSYTNIPITSLKNEHPFKQTKFQDLAKKKKDINKYVNFSNDYINLYPKQVVHIVGNNSCIFLLRHEDSKVEVNITFWMCNGEAFHYLSIHHMNVWIKYLKLRFQTLMTVSTKGQQIHTMHLYMRHNFSNKI